MRSIAVVSGLSGGFSLGGSLEVVAFGGITGSLAGLLYTMLSPYFPTNRLILGFMVGLSVYGALLLLHIEAKMAARGFPELKVAIHLMFGALCVIFGILTVRMHYRIFKENG